MFFLVLVGISSTINPGVVLKLKKNNSKLFMLNFQTKTIVVHIGLNFQKVAIEEKKVEEEAKKAKVTTVKKKAEDLPEIADYDRPDLEQYEKISPTPSTRDKKEADKVHNNFLFK